MYFYLPLWFGSIVRPTINQKASVAFVYLKLLHVHHKNLSIGSFQFLEGFTAAAKSSVKFAQFTWSLQFYEFLESVGRVLTHPELKMGSVDCNVCGKTLSNRSNLNVHLRIHTNELPFMCQICKKGFRQISNLNYHIKSAHTGENRCTHLRIKPRSCQFCGKGFSRFEHLQDHILRHLGERHFPCEHCSMEFYRSSEKQQHCLRAHGQVNHPKQM